MPRSLSLALLLTAAGTSRRFATSSDTPQKKEFQELGGSGSETVLLLALRSSVEAIRNYSREASLSHVVITYTPSMLAEFQQSTAPVKDQLGDLLMLVPGGSTRQQSVHNGLEAIAATSHQPDFVLIHDASRPWASKEIIHATIEAAAACGGAAPYIPLVDALKKIDSEGKICGHFNRDEFCGIQTPQTFSFAEILAAHRTAADSSRLFYDETEIFTAAGGTVQTVPGDPANRKITFISDIPGKLIPR